MKAKKQTKSWTPPALSPEIPSGTLKSKWPDLASKMDGIPQEQKMGYTAIVIGGGLAACAASAALAEQGYNVRMITNLESPRHENTSYMRGGLNASRNYANDGDSDERFFHDTMEYGAWQSREADVYRMAQLSGRVLDICTALGVPFLRDDGGLLLPRPYPGITTARSFQAHGQTGRQLLLAFYAALLRQSAKGRAAIIGRRELTEIVIHSGRAAGIIARNKLNGNEEAYAADAVIIACGGYSDLYNSYPNHLSGGINALWAAYSAGAPFANPCFSLSLPGNANKWQNVAEDYNAAQRCPGGLWTDYLLMSAVPGLFAIGEANFSVHGANCMPGNAPLQELADGLFILPSALGEYFSKNKFEHIGTDNSSFIKAKEKSKEKKEMLLAAKGKIPPHDFHLKLSQIMREKAGFIRYSFRLQQALQEIRDLRKEFYSSLLIPEIKYYNVLYEIAFKTANYLNFAELMVKDALIRKESCGAHFRMDYNPDGKKEEHYIRAWFRSPGGHDIPIREILSFTEKEKTETIYEKVITSAEYGNYFGQVKMRKNNNKTDEDSKKIKKKAAKKRKKR